VAGLVFATLGLFVAASAQAPSPARPLERHHREQSPSSPSVPLDVRNAARISEIALERTPCYGRCPSYTLTLRNDGLVEFTGYEHVSPLGRHVAMIAPRRFTDIAAYVEDIDFFGTHTALSYEGRVVGETSIDVRGNRLAVPREVVEHSTDQPTAFVSVLRDGVRKTISDYGSAAPPRIQVLEGLIDEVRATSKWKRASARTGR